MRWMPARPASTSPPSNGGADLILVEDDGSGMEAGDLALAIERHATSKLPERDGEDDLSHIETLGFRGEALPSIGAVARLSIASRTATARRVRSAWKAARSAGRRPTALSRPRPAWHAGGSARAVLRHAGAAEIPQIARAPKTWPPLDIVKRLAMARPDVGFHLTLDGRRALDLEAGRDLLEGRLTRLARIMGRDFRDNAVQGGWRRAKA